jgi:hypothetical protein
VYYYETYLLTKIIYSILFQRQFKDAIVDDSNAMQNGKEVDDQNLLGKSSQFALFCAFRQRIDDKISKVLMATNRTTSVSFVPCSKHHDEYLQCQMQPLRPHFSNDFITARLLFSRIQRSQNPTSSANDNIKLSTRIYSPSMKIQLAVRRR